MKPVRVIAAKMIKTNITLIKIPMALKSDAFILLKDSLIEESLRFFMKYT
jgi:hypothetical protein